MVGVAPTVVGVVNENAGKLVGVFAIVLLILLVPVNADPADQQRAPFTDPLVFSVGIEVGIVGDGAATNEYEGPSAITKIVDVTGAELVYGLRAMAVKVVLIA